MKKVKYDKISDIIIKLHELVRELDDHTLSFRVRMIADDLAKVGNDLEDLQVEKLSN